MKMKTLNLTNMEFDEMLRKNYSYKDLFEVNANGHHILKHFHYTLSDFTYFNNEATRFFILLNAENQDIIGIVKYATNMLGMVGEEMKYESGCLYYIEISTKYQNQGFLKTLCSLFASQVKLNKFTSNDESHLGRVHSVNKHLKRAFEEQHKLFYKNTDDFWLNDPVAKAYRSR